MTDDIVTRLREDASISYAIVGEFRSISMRDVINEAADEIERLRALVEHLASQVRLQQIANDKAWEAYEQVVRGDAV